MYPGFTPYCTYLDTIFYIPLFTLTKFIWCYFIHLPSNFTSSYNPTSDLFLPLFIWRQTSVPTGTIRIIGAARCTGRTLEVVLGLVDSRGPDRWQAAQPQSLLWVCVHPEVPNSQPGSHSLTSARVSGRVEPGLTPGSPCPLPDTLVSPGSKHWFLHVMQLMQLISKYSSCYSLFMVPGASLLRVKELESCLSWGTASGNNTLRLFGLPFFFRFEYLLSSLLLLLCLSASQKWKPSHRANHKALVFHSREKCDQDPRDGIYDWCDVMLTLCDDYIKCLIDNILNNDII